MITQSTQLLGLAKCKPTLLHKHENKFPVNYSLSPTLPSHLQPSGVMTKTAF